MVWYNVVSSKPIIPTLFQPIGLGVSPVLSNNTDKMTPAYIFHFIPFDCICGMPASQHNRAGLQQHPLVACCSSTPWRLHWRERAWHRITGMKGPWPVLSCPSETRGKIWNASRICMSSLRRGHANLLCIVPILVYVLPKQVHQPNVPRPYLTGHRQ